MSQAREGSSADVGDAAGATDVNELRRAGLLNLGWSLGLLILIGATLPLWIGTSEFPKVPLTSLLLEVSNGADIVLSVVLMASSVLMLLLSASMLATKQKRQRHLGSQLPASNRLVAAVIAVVMVAMFMLNQHRLQPWAYQFFIYALLMSVCRCPRHYVRIAGWVTVSIYIHSALGKFDYQFLFGLGQRFVITVDGFFPGDLIRRNSEWIVWLLPVMELLIGLGLLAGSFKKGSAIVAVAVIAAVVQHCGLVAILGPWGMNHHSGVLIWNVFFLLITVILFWPRQAVGEALAANGLKLSMVEKRPMMVALVVCLAPFFPNCDHWLAWGLYSPSNSRCVVEVVDSGLATGSPLASVLREGSRPYLKKIDLGALSLQMVNAPIYPEARFQLGVARWLQDRPDVESVLQIRIDSKSNRWNGSRTSAPLNSGPQWNPRGGQRFWLNSRCR